MMFIPNKCKHKKSQKGKSFNKSTKTVSLLNRSIFSAKLVSRHFGLLNNKHLNTIRFLIKKVIKKKGFLRFNVFTHQPVTRKPLEVRMGKGKGNVDHWICKIKVGTLICQVFFKKKIKSNVYKVLKQVQLRLPIKTKIFK